MPVLAGMDAAREQEIIIRLGNRIRSIREKKRYSLRELADKADMAYNSIHRIEQGLVNPQITTVILLAEALEVDPAVLVTL